MEREGIEGEEIAARYLSENGYSIRERNWRVGQKEVDIIAEKGELLIIAEVKTQRSQRFGPAAVRVDRGKQKHLIQAANAYVLKKKLDREVRFDILQVIKNEEEEEVRHIENAFTPRW